MALTDKQKAELERNGVANVRLKLASYGGGRASALSGAYPGEEMTRGDVEDWLAEQAQAEAAMAQGTLRWAKIAGIMSIISVGLAVVAIAVSLWLGK